MEKHNNSRHHCSMPTGCQEETPITSSKHNVDKASMCNKAASLPRRRQHHSRGAPNMTKNSYAKTSRQLFCGTSKTILCSFTVSIYLILLMSYIVKPALQQNVHLCPKVCNCDETNLEVICNGPFEKSGLPHTLHPGTKKLIINHAQTSQFSGSYLGLYEHLEILDLAYNKLTSIDLDNIKTNTYLVTLNVSHNGIVEIKDSALSSVMSRLGGNEQLPFTNTNGTSEPEELKKLRKSKISVMELSLSHNQITTLKNYLFMRWQKLQRLDLSYNSLVTLDPESLFGLSKLEYIDLRGNHLVQIPTAALQGTTRSPNYIGSPSDASISALKTIDISENPLVSIGSNSFITLGQAHTLNLDSCSLNTIENYAFEGLSSVTTLSLMNNDLTEVPSEALRAIGSLKLLNMNANDIKVISPYAFRNLYSLEELYLNNGSLRELEAQAFNGLNSLKKLDMSYNPNLIRFNPTVFDNLPKLTYLSMYMCSLTSLQAHETIANHPITILDLRLNSLTCDCDLRWLTKQLKKINETAMSAQRSKALVSHLDSQAREALLDPNLVHEMLNITCSGPPALVGKQIINLPVNKLECIQPSSPLNVLIGFLSLFLMVTALAIACLVNFYHNEKHLFGILKENIAQNRISMNSPYSQDFSKNLDNQTRETQIDSADYEPVDYGPIYTVPTNDQYTTSPSQQHTHQL